MNTRAWAIAAALATLAAAPGAQALPEQTWLVAMGNNSGAPMDVRLLYAEHDAREFSDVLHQLGGVSSRRTTLLLDDDADTARRALQDVNAAIRMRAARGESTALVVYYSGHADVTALHMRGTEFSLDELKTIIEGSPATMRLLVIDACRSGTVTRVKGVTPAASFKIDVNDDVAPEGVAMITSSAAGESSQESDQLRGSFFTHHFVTAMRGAADKNGDGRVTLPEAYEYAYSETLRSSGQTMQLQHPTHSWSEKGRDQLVLTEPLEAEGRVARLRLPTTGRYLIMEKQDGGTIVAEIAPQKDKTDIYLPEGDYFVQQREKTEFREYRVSLKTGQLVSLEDVPYRLVTYDRLVRRRGGTEVYTQSLMILGGGEGGILSGQTAVPELQIGYGFDFDWGSLGLRLSGSTIGSGTSQSDLPQWDQQYGLGLTVQRFVDFSAFSAAFGLLVGGVYEHQSFADFREAPPRDSFGAQFGGILSLEKHLGAGFAARIEGGPITTIYREGIVQDGVTTGSQVATPFTWWAAGGIVWRL